MKKLLILTLLTAMGATLHAEEAAPAADAAAAPTERMSVVFIGANKISVKPGSGKDKSIESTKYAVTPETQITINGEKGELSQIKVGHKVVITPVAGQPDVAASISMTRKSAQ